MGGQKTEGGVKQFYTGTPEKEKDKEKGHYKNSGTTSKPKDNYSLFAFDGKLNEEIIGLEAGQWSQSVTEAEDRRLTFRDTQADLTVGDNIYYRACLESTQSGPEQLKGLWTVPGYVDEAGNPVDPSKSTPAPQELQAPTAYVPEGFPCALSRTEVSFPGFVCKGQLLFEENFKSAITLGKLWTPEPKYPGGPDYPFNEYLNDKALRVTDGRLIITPVPRNSKYGEYLAQQFMDTNDLGCNNNPGSAECIRASNARVRPIITAKITTRDKFSFMYGRIEVLAKMPLGDWLYPEIQLEPRDNEYGVGNYSSGIIRIACLKGNRQFAKILYGGPITCDAEPCRSIHLKQKVGLENWNAEFHNYTVLWRESSITMFVDGEEYGSVGPLFYHSARNLNVAAASLWHKGSSVMAPFDKLFYISLGLNVGGIREFTNSSLKARKNSISEDMLRFWSSRDQWLRTWDEKTSALQIESIRVTAL